jgi:hypothetical protein
MQTAEHRSDDNRLAQVLMANARRDALPDPLMGSSLIEVDLVLANQRIQVPVAEQDDVVEQLTPATAHKYAEPGTLLASTKDVDLMSKHCVLDDQVTSGAAHVDSHAHDLAARGERAQALPDPLGGVSNPICDLREEK